MGRTVGGGGNKATVLRKDVDPRPATGRRGHTTTRLDNKLNTLGSGHLTACRAHEALCKAVREENSLIPMYSSVLTDGAERATGWLARRGGRRPDVGKCFVPDVAYLFKFNIPIYEQGNERSIGED
jgi:hypothetical protein